MRSLFSYYADLLLYMIASVICIVILNVYFSGFLQKRKNAANRIVYLAYIVWQMYLFTMSGLHPYINLAIGAGLNCLVSLTCFKGNALLKIALSGMLSVLWTVSEFLVGYFFMMSGMDYKYPKAAGALLSEILTFILIFCLYQYFQMDNIKNLPAKYCFMLLLLPVGSLFIIYKIFMYGSLLEQGSPIKESAICVIIMLVINLFIFRLCLLLADESVLKRYNAVYAQQLEIYGRHMQEKEIAIAEYRSFKHDMKQHFASLLGMLQERQYESAEEYLNHLAEDTRSAPDHISRTGNIAVDAVINAKYSLMKKFGIGCYADIHIPVSLSFEMTDICVLIGNALDNAIEANNVGNTEIKDKYVKIYMAYDKNILITTIINSYDGKLTTDKAGKILTRKEDQAAHGFGLKAIEKIVQKYHGSVVIEHSQEEFKLKFILMESNCPISITENRSAAH